MVHSQVDIHRYSVTNIHCITKTNMTEAVSLTVILEAVLYRISLLLRVYYWITCGLC